MCCSAIAILSAFCIRQNQIILLILSPTCPVSVVESCKSFAEENKTCYTAFPVSIETLGVGVGLSSCMKHYYPYFDYLKKII